MKAGGGLVAWGGFQIATHLIGNPALPSDDPCEDYHLSNFMNDATAGIAVLNAGLGIGIAGAGFGTAALANPIVAQNAIDAVQGALQPGPPPTSIGGYAGGLGRAAFDKVVK